MNICEVLIISEVYYKYLKEFVEYYLDKLKFNDIIIIDVNDDENILIDYIDNNLIKYKDNLIIYRTQEKGETIQEYQCNEYKNVFIKFIDNYDWFAYFDVDEYLELKEDKTIQDYLSRECFNDYNTILVNWLIYDDNDLIYYDDKPLQERFIRKRYNMMFDDSMKINFIVKSIIRGRRNNKNNSIYYYFDSTHILFTDAENMFNKTCNNCGQQINDIFRGIGIDFNENLAVLKHYYFKTLEEYLDQYVNKNKTIYNQYMEFDVCNFFNYNRNYLTKEKLKYILKYYIDLL